MKPWKILSVVVLLAVFLAFFMTRPIRERSCPLTKSNLDNDPEFERLCLALGRVVIDGKCTCPT
jgi:hypothetical protein